LAHLVLLLDAPVQHPQPVPHVLAEPEQPARDALGLRTVPRPGLERALDGGLLAASAGGWPGPGPGPSGRRLGRAFVGVDDGALERGQPALWLLAHLGPGQLARVGQHAVARATAGVEGGVADG